MDERKWLLTSILWKLTASASQALCKCLMYKNVYILRNGVEPYMPAFIQPCFSHKTFVHCGFVQHAVVTPNSCMRQGITLQKITCVHACNAGSPCFMP